MPQEEVRNTIVRLVEPLLEEKGLELVYLDYKAGKRSHLCIYIDKPGGISLEDCEEASREVSDIMDAYDPIPNSYFLEVSSPGLDRPLVKGKDFLRFLGEKVSVQTFEPMDGRRNFKGTLKSKEEEGIVITLDDGSSVTISYTNIKKANLNATL